MAVTKKVKDEMLQRFQDQYGIMKPALHYNSPFELMIAVILSAQCTDERVNIVTAGLFPEYNTAEKSKRDCRRPFPRNGGAGLIIGSSGTDDGSARPESLYATNASSLIYAREVKISRRRSNFVKKLLTNSEKFYKILAIHTKFHTAISRAAEGWAR